MASTPYSQGACAWQMCCDAKLPIESFLGTAWVAMFAQVFGHAPVAAFDCAIQCDHVADSPGIYVHSDSDKCLYGAKMAEHRCKVERSVALFIPDFERQIQGGKPS